MSEDRGYAVGVVAPPGYAHAEALREAALTVYHGIRRLGRDCVIADNLAARERRNVVFGAQLLAATPHLLPADAVLYNLEQVAPDSPWFDRAVLDLLGRHPVWDYSAHNVAALEGLGVRGATHVPLGYCPELAATPAVEEDIDVVFFGSINPRRARVLDALRERGVRVETYFGVYGAARDALAARAKIVLNLHFYEARVFEIVRVSHMLSQHRFVVSEYGADLDIEGEFSPGVAFAEYEDLADVCLHYLARPQERRRIADQGSALMAARDETVYLSPALAALEGGAGPASLSRPTH
jgi:hypothetical protein